MRRIDLGPFADMICEQVSALDVGRDYGLNPGRDGRCACIFCSGNRRDTLRLYSGSRGFYCFRCHTGGTVISLYRELTGCGFAEAVRGLNDQYGLGLPLDGSDREAVLEARERAEQRKKAREAEQARRMRELENLWDASDAVWQCEQAIRNKAPKTPEEPWDDAFVTALRYRDELTDYRDECFAKVYHPDFFLSCK